MRSSFFAQQGTGVSKELGDLLGPGLFALLMALGRTGYGLTGDRLPLRACLVVSGAGATACYLVAATASHSVFTLLACAGIGPGRFTGSSRRPRNGWATRPLS